MTSSTGPAGHWKSILRIAVSICLLALLFMRGGASLEIVGALMIRALREHPWPLLSAFVLYGGLGSLARGLRWQALVRPLGYPISLARSTELFLVGTFYNQILPTGMGGDVPKALLVARDGGGNGIGKSRAASSVLVDRAMGLLPLLAVGLVAVLIARQYAAPVVTLLLAGTGVAGVLGLALMVRSDLWSPLMQRLPVGGWLLRRRGVVGFIDSFGEYGFRPLVTAAGWGLSFTALLVATNALLGRAVGIQQVPLAAWVIIVPLVALSILLPSIGGLGVREWTYAGLLGTLSPPVDPDTATALSLLFYSMNLLLGLVGGLLFLMRGHVVVDIEAAGTPAG